MHASISAFTRAHRGKFCITTKACTLIVSEAAQLMSGFFSEAGPHSAAAGTTPAMRWRTLPSVGVLACTGAVQLRGRAARRWDSHTRIDDHQGTACCAHGHADCRASWLSSLIQICLAPQQLHTSAPLCSSPVQATSDRAIPSTHRVERCFVSTDTRMMIAQPLSGKIALRGAPVASRPHQRHSQAAPLRVAPVAAQVGDSLQHSRSRNFVT